DPGTRWQATARPGTRRPAPGRGHRHFGGAAWLVAVAAVRRAGPRPGRKRTAQHRPGAFDATFAGAGDAAATVARNANRYRAAADPGAAGRVSARPASRGPATSARRAGRGPSPG